MILFEIQNDILIISKEKRKTAVFYATLYLKKYSTNSIQSNRTIELGANCKWSYNRVQVCVYSMYHRAVNLPLRRHNKICLTSNQMPPFVIRLSKMVIFNDVELSKSFSSGFPYSNISGHLSDPLIWWSSQIRGLFGIVGSVEGLLLVFLISDQTHAICFSQLGFLWWLQLPYCKVSAIFWCGWPSPTHPTCLVFKPVV